MTAVSIADPAPAISPPATIAGFWRRLAAFAFDCLVLAVPAFMLGLALFDWATSLGQAGRLIGFAMALLYFGLLNSRFGGGQTLGKRLLGIRVVDRNGDTLSAMRSVVRFLMLGIPYFLNGLWFDLDPSSIGPAIRMLFVLLVLLVFGGGGAIVYLFVFNRRTRQSLHDLVVGSFVVRRLSEPSPVNLSTPPLHLIVTGCWLALTVIVPSIFTWIAYQHREDLAKITQPPNSLQATIKTQIGCGRPESRSAVLS